MTLRWLATIAIACIVVTGSAGGTGGTAAAQSGSETASTSSLRVTPISVPEGTLRVYLPDDIAAGDTISGTVVAEPAGNTDEQRSRNASVLNGYVVDIGTAKANAASHVFIATGLAAPMYMIARSSKGREVRRISVPIQPQQPAFPRVAVPNDFHFPQVVAGGQPFAIRGPFSGDFQKTSLAVGGQPVEKLAQSPRTFVAAPSPNISGPTNYQLNERGVAVTAPCNVISLKLTAPKTRLTRGEHTTIHIAVTGLDGIRAPVPLLLENSTPGVVSLTGGQVQLLTIAPSDVGSGRPYGADRDVTGVGTGGFSISATIDEHNRALVDGAPVTPQGGTTTSRPTTTETTVPSQPPTTTTTATPHPKKNPITSDWPPLSDADKKSVQALLDKGAGSRADALAELVKIMKKYCCNFDTMSGGAPVYDPATEGEGATERKKGGTVSIGPDAFSSVAWLYSSLKHEMVHSQQWQDPDAADKMGSKGREKQAYQREVDNAGNTGLSAAEKAEDEKRLEKYK